DFGKIFKRSRRRQKVYSRKHTVQDLYKNGWSLGVPYPGIQVLLPLNATPDPRPDKFLESLWTTLISEMEPVSLTLSQAHELAIQLELLPPAYAKVLSRNSLDANPAIEEFAV